ncbi:MAG: GlxA family transcriptional regulator, partial [Pseudomonadota bacterium]
NALDVVGPLDIFAATNVLDAEANSSYEIEVVSPQGGLIKTYPSGVCIQTKRLSKHKRRPIDTILVAGGEAFRTAQQSNAITNWLRREGPQARRVASVCTGAFILAAAGLLNGRRATTHWRWAEDLQNEYPDLKVNIDAIFTKDENIYTSAGITAGMDLALALVEEDLGANSARTVARNWVIFAKRPGGQSQFSALLPANDDDGERALEQTIAWIHDHPEADLSVDALAEKSNMSARHFARRFREETGLTPAKYVETIRLQAARGHLESSNESVESIARHTGFLNSERMRRVFIRHLHVSPQDYRSRFQL